MSWNCDVRTVIWRTFHSFQFKLRTYWITLLKWLHVVMRWFNFAPQAADNAWKWFPVIIWKKRWLNLLQIRCVLVLDISSELTWLIVTQVLKGNLLKYTYWSGFITVSEGDMSKPQPRTSSEYRIHNAVLMIQHIRQHIQNAMQIVAESYCANHRLFSSSLKIYFMIRPNSNTVISVYLKHSWTLLSFTAEDTTHVVDRLPLVMRHFLSEDSCGTVHWVGCFRVSQLCKERRMLFH